MFDVFLYKNEQLFLLATRATQKKQAAQRGPPAMFVVKWKD